jgi:site-specific DNA-cytosine methylase
MKYNVLSLFDGIAGCRQALERAGLTVAAYYASEINLRSIMINPIQISGYDSGW